MAQSAGAEAALTHLRALDVVVQVVPERVDQVDGVSSTGVAMVREEHKRNVADVVTHGGIGIFQL